MFLYWCGIMSDYSSYYLSLNDNFKDIISECLNEKNIPMHAKASSFLKDFKNWIEIIEDFSFETCIYNEAFQEYNSMILFWTMGLYKHAYFALRSCIELLSFGIFLSTNELNYRLWKQGQFDISWAAIVDENSGVYSKNFIKCFAPNFSSTNSAFLRLSKNLYRECSEYVHSNFNIIVTLPESFMFDQKTFEDLGKKAEIATQIITYLFLIRYNEKLDSVSKIKLENTIIENLSWLPEAHEFYN